LQQALGVTRKKIAYYEAALEAVTEKAYHWHFVCVFQQKVKIFGKNFVILNL